MHLPDLIIHPMTFWDHAVAVIICVFAPALAFSSRKVTLEDIQLEQAGKIRLYHNNALLLTVFALVVITTWRLPGRSLAELGFAKPEWNAWVILFLLTIVLLYALDLFFQYGLKRWRERTFARHSAAATFTPADRKELMHFLFLALAAGIGEEIIFRGFLIQYLVSWTGNTPEGILASAFFSSALFAYLHGYQGYRSVLKIFVFALLFAAIFLLSRSLILVIIVHAVIDMISGWLSIHLLRSLRQHQQESENDL